MRLPTCNQGWPTTKCPCRYDHHWMARWYQGCSKSIMTIPWTMWFTHCRGWTYPMWRSNHHSPGERKVLEQIHQRHLGTSKCQYRARQCVYWPGINKDMKQLVEACHTCQRHWPQEPRQPLKPTPPLEQPWQQLGADFMMFNGSKYLVFVDSYSKMPIVLMMPTSQCNSAKMITVLKELSAEHGIPEEIWSDNRPQFASHLFTEFTKDWNIKHSNLYQGNSGAMDKQNLQLRLFKVCLPMPSALDRFHISLC